MRIRKKAQLRFQPSCPRWPCPRSTCVLQKCLVQGGAGASRCISYRLEPSVRDGGKVLVCVYAAEMYINELRTKWNPPSSKNHISSRVPFVRALRLARGLLMKVLVPKSASQLWWWLVCLELESSVPAAMCSLGRSIGPTTLGRHHLRVSGFTQPRRGSIASVPRATTVRPWARPADGQGCVAGVPAASILRGKIPSDYRRSCVFNLFAAVVVRTTVDQPALTFRGLSLCGDSGRTSMGPQPGYGRVYRRNASTSPFVGIVWSALLLQQLEFGPGFDQPLAGVAWPASLQRLSFGQKLNRPIVEVV